MNIAVCDDNIITVEAIENNIIKSFNEMKADVKLLSYTNGSELIETAKKLENGFDVVFLDIDMPDISGFEVAKALREINADILIIFVSSYDNYVFDSIEYSPFRYIRKFRMEEELSSALKAACIQIEKKRKKFIIIKSDNIEYRVFHSDIMYFEIYKRRIYVYLNNGEVINTWKTIKEFYMDLNDEDFVKINNGCVVNMKYIKAYTSNEVILDNGVKLLTSREGRKELKKELFRYWSQYYYN